MEMEFKDLEVFCGFIATPDGNAVPVSAIRVLIPYDEEDCVSIRFASSGAAWPPEALVVRGVADWRELAKRLSAK